MISGTATAYATMAAEIMIVAILYRQGMRLVQCFAFLKNDIFLYLFLIKISVLVPYGGSHFH